MNCRSLFVGFFLAVILAMTATPLMAFQLSDLEGYIFEKTNRVRTAHGLPAFQLDFRARDAARGHSEEMSRLGYREHYSPTPGHGTPAERAWAARISTIAVGENVAVYSVSTRGVEELAQDIVDGWMDSSGHRANILSEHFTHLGVGAGRGQHEGRDSVFLTQTFLGRTILDARLTLERSETTNLRMRISGRTASSLPMITLWKEHGETKFADLPVTNGVFSQTFLLPKNLGDVEILVGKRAARSDLPAGQFSVEVTDRFLVNTVRQSIEPPPY